jgi:hypothetical protein
MFGMIWNIVLIGPSHDNVRRMLGSFEDDRWVYIVLEYIPNAKPLNNRLRDLLSNKFVFPPSVINPLSLTMRSAKSFSRMLPSLCLVYHRLWNMFTVRG